MARTDLRVAPPLPSSIDEWERVSKAERTLNDLVEEVHRVLVDDDKLGERYRSLLRAVYDAHAVEGSLAADNVLAAMMIRDKAAEMRSTEIVSEKLAIISMSLNVVLRRYKSSRKERRQMLAGEVVPGDSGD